MTVLMNTPVRRMPVQVCSVSSGPHHFHIFVWGWAAVALAPPGSQVAAWWPGAGASSLLFRVRIVEQVYVYALLIASTALSNLVAVRPPVFSICLGVANVGEVVVVGVVTSRSLPLPRGAIVIGGLAGCTVAALEREQRAIANLTELHRTKEEDVTSASYELRTPLTSILGFAEVLTDMDDLAPSGAKSATTIHRNAKLLADNVQDILLLGTRTKAPLRNGGADLAATISEVIESLAPMVGQTKPTLRLGAHVDATTVSVSVLDLSPILTNLISNELKYSLEGETVTVPSTSTDGQAVVEISDVGGGMPEEVPAHVFERFCRASGAEGENIVGTGLGLSLARSLVNGAGGQIELVSSPRQGVSAFVALPRTGRVDRKDDSLHG